MNPPQAERRRGLAARELEAGMRYRLLRGGFGRRLPPAVAGAKAHKMGESRKFRL